MKKKDILKEDDNLTKAKQSLYQLHAMGHVISSISIDDLACIPNDVSYPLDTIGQIVMEKTKSCLCELEQVEKHFSRKMEG